LVKLYLYVYFSTNPFGAKHFPKKIPAIKKAVAFPEQYRAKITLFYYLWHKKVNNLQSDY